MKNAKIICFIFFFISSCATNTNDIRYSAYIDGCNDTLYDVMAATSQGLQVSQSDMVIRYCNMKAQQKYMPSEASGDLLNI